MWKQREGREVDIMRMLDRWTWGREGDAFQRASARFCSATPAVPREGSAQVKGPLTSML